MFLSGVSMKQLFWKQNRGQTQPMSRSTPDKIHPAPLKLPEMEQPPASLPVRTSQSIKRGLSCRDSLDALQQQAALAALKHYSSNQTDQSTKRVGVAILDPFIIETKSTLGAAVFGPFGAKILFGLMKGPSGVVVNILLVAGAIITSFAFTKNIDYEYSYFAFLMMPCLLAVASTMNTEIIRQICGCFDSMLLLGEARERSSEFCYEISLHNSNEVRYARSLTTGYGTGAVIPLLISCSDARICTACLGYMYIIMLVFTDACPEKVRRAVGRIGSVTLIAWLMTLLFALKSNKVKDLNTAGFEFGGTIYSTIDIMFISGSNYCIFLAHHIYNAFAHPANFVVLTSRMKSVKVENEDAMTLTTVQKEVKRRESSISPSSGRSSSRRSESPNERRSFFERK